MEGFLLFRTVCSSYQEHNVIVSPKVPMLSNYADLMRRVYQNGWENRPVRGRVFQV